MEETNFFISISGYMPLIIKGLLITIKLTLIAGGMGFCIAVPMVVLSLYSYKPVKWAISAIILVIKGTPLLVQLFFIYYGVPSIDIDGLISNLHLNWFFTDILGWMTIPDRIRVTPIGAALAGFIINSACYQADYIRGGFYAISRTQMEAAYSIGLSKWGAVRTIMVPQAIRFSIPALSNEIVYLLQYTSVAGIIQLKEFYSSFQDFYHATYYFVPSFIIMSIVYLSLIFVVTKLFESVDKLMRIPGTSGSPIS